MRDVVMTNPILLTTSCKKCGKPLLTAKCSLYGNQKAKLKFDRICSHCITEEQLQEILKISK